MSKAILVVEDSVEDAILIKNYLNSGGYSNITFVTNYDKAVESLKNSQYDAVLIDINLNDDADGILLAETIDSDFHTPYLFVTGQNSASILKTVGGLKYKNFIPKPIQKENLLSNLEIILSCYSKYVQIAKHYLYDINKMRAFCNSKPIKLTPNQTKLLHILALNINRYVKRDDIIFYILSFLFK